MKIIKATFILKLKSSFRPHINTWTITTSSMACIQSYVQMEAGWVYNVATEDSFIKFRYIQYSQLLELMIKP